MDINKLRYFCAIVESQTLRAASEYLEISPGALSRAMSSLQKELNKQLFVVSGRNLILTDVGRLIYPRVKKLLEEYQNLRGLEVHSERKATLATFEVFSTHVLSGFIASSQIEIGITCYELTPGKIEESVLNRTVDLGLTYIPVPHPELQHLRVTSFQFGLFGLPKWKRKSFRELPFAVPTTTVPMTPSQIRGIDTWPAQVFRNVKYEFEMLETALATSSSGLSVLYCPKFVVSEYNKRILPEHRLAELIAPSVPTPTQHIYLVIPQNQEESAFSKKLTAYLRKLKSN